jgi:nitroreductase
MEPEGSLLCWLQPATGPCPESHESSPVHHFYSAHIFNPISVRSYLILSYCLFLCPRIVLKKALKYCVRMDFMSRDRSVGIATGWTAGFLFPARQEIFSLSGSVETSSGDPPGLLSNGYPGLLAGGIAAGARSWPLASIHCRGQEWWNLHSPIRLHGMVLLN